MNEPWYLAGNEPDLEDLLSDPVVLALMDRDGVSRAELDSLISDAVQRLSGAGAAGPLLTVA